jgi:hypothetical protein
MKSRLFLGLIFMLVLLLAACGGETADSPTPAIEGPALLMFYTDN